MIITHPQAANHEVGVRHAVTTFCIALNAIFIGAVAPMDAVWSHADDVTYMGPDGAYYKGWAAVLAEWERQAAVKLGGSVEVMDIRIVTSGDLAVVYNIVKGANLDHAGRPYAVSLRAAEVFRMEAGTWKVIGVHTDVLPLLTA